MILVVGATGALGGLVVERLAADGHAVRALVRGTGAAAAATRPNADGAMLPVGGPAAISWRDVVAAYEEALGAPSRWWRCSRRSRATIRPWT